MSIFRIIFIIVSFHPEHEQHIFQLKKYKYLENYGFIFYLKLKTADTLSCKSRRHLSLDRNEMTDTVAMISYSANTYY